MILDRTLAREIRKEANGDGTRDAKFAFLEKVRGARKTLSTPEVVRGKFNEALKEYGRVPVAVCLAVTIWERRDRLESSTVKWARAVLDIWTNKPANILTAYIDDGIHPTRIEEYAGGFIRATTEEP